MAPFRRVFRVFWWIICCLAFLALPLAVWDFTRKGYDIKYQAWFIGGIFAILSVPISTYGVAMHTEYYTRPQLQRHVIRILWMVPIYSVDAWFALRFRSAREYLDPIRECYEAYVIYNFFAYLMAYLEEELGDVEAHLISKPPMRHLPPFKWILDSWPMGQPFLFSCKKGIMNYVILRPITTLAAFVTDNVGLYGQGRVDFTKSYVYLTATTNFSQLWALYCLGQMYWAVHKELAPIRPLSKFICIKSVVFLTFWQGTLLAVLVSSGLITDNSWSTYDQLGVATGIQDFLICIEMFLAAIAHSYAFPPKDYMHPSDQCELDGGFLHNVKHMFDLGDVVHDVHLVVSQHMGVAASATKHAVFQVTKAAILRTAQGMGIIKRVSEDGQGEGKSRMLPELQSADYHPMDRGSEDGEGCEEDQGNCNGRAGPADLEQSADSSRSNKRGSSLGGKAGSKGGLGKTGKGGMKTVGGTGFGGKGEGGVVWADVPLMTIRDDAAQALTDLRPGLSKSAPPLPLSASLPNITDATQSLHVPTLSAELDAPTQCMQQASSQAVHQLHKSSRSVLRSSADPIVTDSQAPPLSHIDSSRHSITVRLAGQKLQQGEEDERGLLIHLGLQQPSEQQERQQGELERGSLQQGLQQHSEQQERQQQPHKAQRVPLAVMRKGIHNAPIIMESPNQQPLYLGHQDRPG